MLDRSISREKPQTEASLSRQ